MAFERWRDNNKILGALINHSSQCGEIGYMDVGHGVMENLHNADSGKLETRRLGIMRPQPSYIHIEHTLRRTRAGSRIRSAREK